MKKFLSYTLVSTFILASCSEGRDSGGGNFCSNAPNSAPVITTNNDDYIYMQENQTIAFTVEATDADGDVINFTKNQKDDGGLYINGSTFFNSEDLIDIDKFTGVVTFNEAPDYENPVDTDGDNIYKIYLSVNDEKDCFTPYVRNRIYKIFEIKVTNDPSDDDDEAWSPWDGNLILNNDYAPYDKHLTSYGLIVAGLPDVTEDFMKKIGDLTTEYSNVKPLKERAWPDESGFPKTLKDTVFIKHIKGPLFFGSTSDFQQLYKQIPDTATTVVLRLGKMQYMDQSGLYAMEDMIQELQTKNVEVFFVNVLKQPRYMMERIDIIPDFIPEEHIYTDFDACIKGLVK